MIALFGAEPLDAVWLASCSPRSSSSRATSSRRRCSRQALRINPLLVIFALLIGGQLYGIIGAFIALPIAAVVRETVVYLRRHLVLEPWGTRAPPVALAGAGTPPRAAAAPSAAPTAAPGRRVLPGVRDRAGRRRRGRRRGSAAPSDSLERMAASLTAAPALRAEALSKATASGGRCSGVSFRPRAASWWRSSGPTAPARRRCCRSSPARSSRRRDGVAGPARGRLGAAAAGALLEALGGREPAPVRAPGEGRRRRGGRRPDARADRPADRAGDEVGKLSGGNRQRVNIAIGLLAEPPVLLLDEPSSSLDPRQRERCGSSSAACARGGTTVVYSTHNVAEAERYADRVLVLADGELLFTARPRELERTAGGARRRLRGARSCASCAAGPLTRALAAPQGPADPAPLAAAGRRCSSLYPVLVALLIGFALSPAPSKPKVAFVNLVPPERGDVHVGGEQLDASELRRRAVRRRSTRCASTPARRRSRRCAPARRSARSSSRPTSTERLQGTLSLGGGDRGRRSRSSTTPRTRSSAATSRSTIDAQLADANQALSDSAARSRAELPRPDPRRAASSRSSGGDSTCSACERARRSSRRRSRRCRPTRRSARRSSRSRASPASPPTTSTSRSRSSPRSASPVQRQADARSGPHAARRVRRRGRGDASR